MIPIKDNIPTDRFPFVTAGLILANFIVYILAVRHGGSFIGGPDLQEVVKYGAIPFPLTHPGYHCALVQVGSNTDVSCVHHTLPNTIATWATPFTGMFMHASILHIAGNMLFLWIFGNNIEDRAGSIRYLIFYLAAGLAATATFVALDPHGTVPMIGASGAIAGVMGAYLVLFPTCASAR